MTQIEKGGRTIALRGRRRRRCKNDDEKKREKKIRKRP